MKNNKSKKHKHRINSHPIGDQMQKCYFIQKNGQDYHRFPLHNLLDVKCYLTRVRVNDDNSNHWTYKVGYIQHGKVLNIRLNGPIKL